MIIRGKVPGTESPVDIVVEHGKVIRIDPCQKGSLYDFGGEDAYICPGFFDPQVNGFAGVDLASAIRMVAKNAQKLFSEVKGEILSGSSANLVLFEYRNNLAVRSTWIEGEKIS